MKKNFLFKGVHVLGAVMLFASAILPGWQVYATDAFSPIKVADITNEALASETYNFTSYAEEAATTEYATGAVKVINKGTIVNVTENYEIDNSVFSGQTFVVQSTNFVDGGEHELYLSDGKTQQVDGIKVKISNENKGESETTYDFESYAGTTKWGEGTVKVLNQGTIVKVTENYQADVATFSGGIFYVNATEISNSCLELYSDISDTSLSPKQVYVKVGEDLGGNLYGFESYGDNQCTIGWGFGKVEVVSGGYGTHTAVKVVENYMVTDDALSFSGSTFFVTGTVYPNGDDTYLLYDQANTDTDLGIYVKITGTTTDGYTFKSYSKATDQLWGAGKVEVVNGYTTVQVVKNYARGSFEGENFVVYDTVYDGTKTYKLYGVDGSDSNLWVKLSGNEGTTYNFTSYAEEAATTEYAIGKVEFVTGFTTVEVTENSIEGFVGNKFVVYATELSASDTVYPLYTTGGDVAGIYVKIEAIPQTTPSSSSNYSGGGGGGSSKSSASSSNESKTAEKATDTAKADEQKADDAKADENKNEAPAAQETAAPTPMTEAQAVAKFGQEQIDAYKWAHDKGITTMDTVEDARLDEPLTRAELAKMMVVYMAKIAKKSPVVTGTVSYPDVKSEELGDLAGYIQLAYQFQIMGVDANGNPIEEFMPNALVTRGEYATVFSRVLFGSLFNQEGEDFYSKHIAALNAAGILTNTDPTIQEMRGWVMLMMYRSSQNLEEIAKVAAEIGATDEEVEAGKKAAEILAEEEAKAETTTGDVAEAPIAEEQAQATTGDVVEAPAAKEQAEAATGDVAEVPAVEETASAEANTGEVAAEPSNN